MGERKKRDYAFWGCRFKPYQCGELKEKVEQIRELPEIGKRVVVHECIVYERPESTEGVVSAYKPSRKYFDVWGFPAVYRVASYTRGRENALDKRNQILLERVCKGGYIMRASVSALDAAIGVVLLQEIEREEDVKALQKPSNYFSYRQAIVRETREELMNAMIKKTKRVHEKAV